MRNNRWLITRPLSEGDDYAIPEGIVPQFVHALQIVSLPNLQLPAPAPMMIVSSPNALYAIEHLLHDGWGSEAQWACVGKRSAKWIKNQGFTLTWFAESAEELCEQLPTNIEHAQLFCGKDRRMVIEQFFAQNRMRLDVHEVYWTQQTFPNVKLDEYDAVFFYSPRNVESMLRGKTWLKGPIAVAIGNTTGDALKEKHVEPIVVAASPSTEEMINAYLKYEQNGNPE